MKTKVISIFVIWLATNCPLWSLASARESAPAQQELQEHIEGTPMLIESESMLNWREVCRHWVLAKPKGTLILEVDCGKPRCEDIDGYFVCGSSAWKRVEKLKPSDDDQQ